MRRSGRVGRLSSLILIQRVWTSGPGGILCCVLMRMKDGDRENGDMVWKSTGQMTSVDDDGDGGSGWIDTRLNERSSHCRLFHSQGLCLSPGSGQRLQTWAAWFGWVVGRTRTVDDAENVCLDLAGAG